jgi:histidine kinase
MRLRTVLLLLTTAAVVAATAATWFLVYEKELTDLDGRVDEGLSLKKSNIITEADRYRYLPSIVAQDDRILKLLDRPDDPMRVDLANRYLETVNRSAGAHDLFVLDTTVRCKPRCSDRGTTLASSNWQDADSRVGKNYGFRVYFKDAVARAKGATGEGRYYAIGATSGIPGYYLARRVRTPAGSVGVAVVKVHLSQLEDAWTEAGEQVGLVDRAGMIFISNVEAWKYSPLYPLSKDDRERLLAERQYRAKYLDNPPLQPDRELKPGRTFKLQFSAPTLTGLPATTIRPFRAPLLQGRTMLVRLLDIPSHDWRILAALDVAPVYDDASRDAAIVFLVSALLVAAGFYLHERRERVQADRLRTILEDMSIGIAVFDPDLRLVAWNSPYIRLNSYPETLVRADRPLAEIIEHNAQRGDYGPGDPKQQVQVRLDGVWQQRQTEVRRPDGTWLDMRHSRTSGGWLVRTYSDITERKQAEAELDAHRNNLESLVTERTAQLVQVNARLQEAKEQAEAAKEQAEAAKEQAEAAKRDAEQANRAKTTFLNSVSHDIRNPLNAILGYAGLVLANAKESLPERQYQNLQKLAAKGQELNEMVNDFLDYTRADRVTTSEFALAPLIRETIVTIEPMVDGQHVHVTCDIPDDLPRLIQDERKLKRVVINLLTNAAKFTERGTIAVSVRRRNNLVDISVADSGIGIAQEFLGRIFEEFERIESRGERPREGTGLGLSICRRFATLMSGEVTVQSSPGQGSTFTLSIPIVHPKATVAPEAPAAASAVQPGLAVRRANGAGDRRPTVLVVDDSKENRDFLAQLLEKHYRVLVAEDGKKAIDVTQRERPDLILMDLSLPVVNGWEATRAIKSDAKLRRIPIIAVTAHAAKEDWDGIRAAGCDSFLAKPVDETALFEALRHYLGSPDEA